MKHVFYFMILVLALYELTKALNCKKMYKRVHEYKKLDNDAKLGYFKAHPMLYLVTFIELIECIMMVAGLLTSQWLCFAVVIVLSLSRLQKLGAWAVCVDGIVTTAVYIFAALNTYHFHITFF